MAIDQPPAPSPQPRAARRPRFVIGIDLGTTNSAVAYIDTADPLPRARSLPIPQLVAEATLGERPTLPSFLYVAGEHDVVPGALALPWDAARTFAVGEFARVQGARVPGRLVTSAKSWLCHGGVDREAAILPWAAPEDVPRLSPVDVSARYLQHIREAWSQTHPEAPLEEQDVILTVPASFDEVARELTVAAASRAGLGRVVLLEEPQAAFYAWIHAHEGDWQQRLGETRLALVIDVGGGTSDFSLVAVRPDGATFALERLAVGDHILLGGDNIDVALARLLEPRLGEKLDSQRWYALTSACRDAKEILLGSDPPAEVPIRIAGRGRSVVGGLLSTTLGREEVLNLVLDGFFPLRGAADLPRRQARAGLQEWGLPFADEPEVPRHIAAFLTQHARDAAAASGGAGSARPDAVLFNGGALKPDVVRERLTRLLASWNDGREPRILESADLDLAVARGAAYYGLARRGLGVRIGGGSPRAYFLGVAGRNDDRDTVRALCLLPRGMHEGEEIELSEREFTVIANRPVSFPLFASSTRLGDRPGEIVDVERESIGALPPIRTVLRFGKKLAATEIPVHVLGKLTEVGTLEVWCRSLKTDHRWRLQFALRERSSEVADDEGENVSDSADLEVAGERVAAAEREIRGTFALAQAPGERDPVSLVRRLEETLAAGKDAWPIDVIRRLWDVLWEGREAAAFGDRHEARWLNLAGFLLRPGFGHELDEWRVQQLWRLISGGLRFPRSTQCRVEWWNMWKRVAGGLSRTQQQELYNQVAPLLLPRLRSKAKSGSSAVGPQEVREYWQLAASCERLSAATKAELGAVLVKPIAKGKATDAEIWALGRLGARAPFAGPINCVVAKDTVAEWVEELLATEWRRPDSMGFAMVQLARLVGDRERDLDEDLRKRLAERLRVLPAGDRAARLVTEIVPLGRQERARILAESLPVGLQVRESASGPVSG